MEDVDASSEAFVMVQGPPPSEAAHIYNRFFFNLAKKTYSAATVKAIEARRLHPDLGGQLFYDELLNLALMRKADENEYTEGRQDPSHFYPPKAEDADSVVELIQRIQASSYDRIKKMALWYYIMLDLDSQDGGKAEKALQFAGEVGLPRSARHAMTGYWMLDRGDYPSAVSYLTEEPDFVSKIVSAISPLPYTSTSSQETSGRALALSLFLSLVDVQALGVEADDDFQEANIVATCWSQGVRAAWVQSQALSSPTAGTEEGSEELEQLRSRCIGRILEYCFMPEARPDAVKALLALALSEAEEEVLCHSMINSPSGIHLSAYAHAVALDVLLVRRINSGQYYDAILLNRRINATVGLPHLSRQVSSDLERQKLALLRAKRQGLIRNAHSVLTSVEQQMLDIGEREANGNGEKSELEMSWEKLGESNQERQGTPQRKLRGGDSRPLTPLSASPALRTDKANESASESFLSAVVRASPNRGKGDASFHSGMASPLSRSLLQGSPSASRSASLRRATETPSRTPSRSAPIPRDSGPAPSPLRLSASRPYQLAPAKGSVEQAKSPAMQPQDGGLVDGPYSRLALQLQEEMNEGDLSIDRILGGHPSTRGSRQASLSFSRPVRRYEAKYEIRGQGDDGDGAQEGSAGESGGDGDLEMEEVPQRRGRRGKAKKKAEGRRGGEPEDDASLPGTFPPAQTTAVHKKQSAQASKEEDKTPAKRRSSRSAAANRRSEMAAERDGDEEDEVPEMVSTPSVRKSRSGVSLTKSRSSSKVVGSTNTPVRRSARLSVEPESRPPVEDRRSASPTKEQKGRRRANSKGPTLASASEVDETENEKEGEGEKTGRVMRTRSRRGSKMPGSF